MRIGSSLWDLFLLLTAPVANNRFLQLKDVTLGLIYMHGQAMIHGDLKGV